MEALSGRTYSLFEENTYFEYIADQVDRFAGQLGGERALDLLLAKLIDRNGPAGENAEFERLFAPVSARLAARHTSQLAAFLAGRNPADDDDEIFLISARGYHLRMMSIEVMNRVLFADFSATRHKVAILAHCLRDFRAADCQFEAGDVDHVCLGCTGECQINQAGLLFDQYPGWHLNISQDLDLEKVFNAARRKYDDIGLLGVACVPELYQGMLLSRQMGIPCQGLPLNYNRCRRWLGEAQPTSFNLEQLRRMVQTTA